jgi:hypothetical protein
MSTFVNSLHEAIAAGLKSLGAFTAREMLIFFFTERKLKISCCPKPIDVIYNGLQKSGTTSEFSYFYPLIFNFERS